MDRKTLTHLVFSNTIMMTEHALFLDLLSSSFSPSLAISLTIYQYHSLRSSLPLSFLPHFLFPSLPPLLFPLFLLFFSFPHFSSPPSFLPFTSPFFLPHFLFLSLLLSLTSLPLSLSPLFFVSLPPSFTLGCSCLEAYGKEGGEGERKEKKIEGEG